MIATNSAIQQSIDTVTHPNIYPSPSTISTLRTTSIETKINITMPIQ